MSVTYLFKNNLQKQKDNDLKIEGKLINFQDIVFQEFDFSKNSTLFEQHFPLIVVNKKNSSKFESKNLKLVPSSGIASLKLSEQSVYSTAFNEDAHITTNEIYEFYRYNIDNTNKITLTDACANIGGNTIHFALKFSLVNSIEFNESEYNRLSSNVKNYQFNNVKTILGDSLKNIFTQNINQDIIFFDPPWGGRTFKKYKLLGLSLGENDIVNDINQILDMNLAKLVVLKGPFNTSILDSKYLVTSSCYYKTVHTKNKPQTNELYKLFFFCKTDKNIIKSYLYSKLNRNILLNFNNIKTNTSMILDDNIEILSPSGNSSIEGFVYNIEYTFEDINKYNNPLTIIYNLEKENHFEPIFQVEKYTNNNIKNLKSVFENKTIDTEILLKESTEISTTIVTKELLRQELFNDIKQNIIKYFIKYFLSSRINPDLAQTEIEKIINRFIFVNLTFKEESDDSVLFFSKRFLKNYKSSNEIYKYLETNFKYFVQKYKFNNLNINEVYDYFSHQFFNNSLFLLSNKIQTDGKIYLDKSNSSDYNFMYEYSTINNLNEENVHTISIPIFKNILKFNSIENLINSPLKYYYVACYLRYHYLNLTTLALAFDYKNNEYTKNFKPDITLECFSSIFNRYYKNFCSAFSDLEGEFGSLGSFFDLPINEIVKFKNLVINPPFDNFIITKTYTKITEIIKYVKINNINCRMIIILPYWKDFDIINKLIQITSVAGSYSIYDKDKIPYIDYFNEKEKIINAVETIIFSL